LRRRAALAVTIAGRVWHIEAVLGEYRWRPLTNSVADTDFVVALRNDPRFAPWFYRSDVTPETHRKFIRGAEERGEINWVVQRGEQRVGVASIYHIDLQNRKAECGRTIFLHPKVFHLNWVVSAVVTFEILELNKAYIETLAENRIIARGVERLGMTREALLRQHVIGADGRRLDVLLYTILADEWRAIREATFAKWGTPKVSSAAVGETSE
jgi:RimJ/RimL family protein N-acetyltransferase